MDKKIKKDDRAFLYFRENREGTINVKFGPKKYSKDTEKFYELMMKGFYNCLLFLSGVMSELSIEEREGAYEKISLAFGSMLSDSFKDVFDKKKKEYELEELAIERVEKGEFNPSEEFKEKISETKKEIGKRKEKTQLLNVKKQQEEYRKILEDEMERVTRASDAIRKYFYRPNFVTTIRKISEEDVQLTIDILEERMKNLTAQYPAPEEIKEKEDA
jgi:hypothetical protein